MTIAKSSDIAAWARRAIAQARYRAKQRGLPCNLTTRQVAELATPYCPALGLRLDYSGRPRGRAEPNSPSLDRLDPAGGYVPGNVVVLSSRANTLKRDATADELNGVAAFVRQITP